MTESGNGAGPKLSIVLPAKNEARGLETLLPELRAHYPNAQILVVDDGSTDDTATVCDRAGVTRADHLYARGNGAGIKTGARLATGDVLVFMDADGQHDPADIGALVAAIQNGYDLAVGARDGAAQANAIRSTANRFFNRLASLFVGQSIRDLTSGFRACRAAPFREFLCLLPNGFSYPTTSTMAFFRAGYSVAYVPVTVRRRDKNNGQRSHIRVFRDGARFLLIIFRIGTLYSPLKLFLPISAFFFAAGLGRYLYTYATAGQFTNGAGLLLTSSVLIFLIGLVSEQITQLLFAQRND